jgi:magnesium-protoporphyrin O-methyltransferase
MPACCSPFQGAAERQFDEAKAAQELASYRKKGPGPTTRLLEAGIAQSGVLSGTVIDVGSGVGALTFALLDRGVANAIAVDASNADLSAAREEAARRGREQSISFVHADFVVAATDLPAATLVVLDRVVCCYPSSDALIGAVLQCAERCVALSYPRDLWYVRLAMAVENGRRWLGRNPFRTFVHPARRIEQTITAAGFTRHSRRRTWMWSADIYVRSKPQGKS